MSAIFVPRRISQQLDVSFGTVANDDFLQRKSGAWANRTVAQVKADLGLSGTNSGDQTITLTGDVTGTGTGSFAVTLATVTVSKGGTGLSSATAYAVLCGGTTGTGAFQSPGTGTAGQILTSGGASALPTWSSSISVTTIASTGANTNTQTGLGTTTAAAFIAQNITAAAAGAQQISSSVDVVGQGWKTNATAASQEVRGRMNILPVQGAANPTGTLQFQIGINGATPTNVMTLTSAGILTTTGGIQAGGSLIANSGNSVQWISRSVMASPTDGSVRLTNNAQTSGATLDITTDGTLKIRDRTNAADATVTAGAITASGAVTASANGAASTPAVNITGVPFAGTGTTSYPLVYINETGATASTVLSTSGTLFGVNGNGTADLMNLLKDGVSQCKVTSGGNLTITGILTIGVGALRDYGSGQIGIGGPSANVIYVAAAHLQLGSVGVAFGSSDGLSAQDTWINRKSAANLRQGAADAASPVSQTFSVQNVSTGTSNTAGANRTFSASQGTGTGAGGNIIFTVAPPSGSSGSTQNALVTALTIKGDAERCVEVEKLLSIVARAVSTLPSAATYAGCCANVNDALTPVAGVTVAGGGAARALVWSDGTNWKVVIA